MVGDEHRAQGTDNPAVSAADASRVEQLALLRPWLIGGTLLSLLGFALPWFRVSRSYRWWYGGWGLLTTNEPDLAWIGLIFFGYALVLLAAAFLPRFGLPETILLTALAIGVACGTLIVVALAAADAVNDLGRVYRLDLNIGLLLLVTGHGAMIATAIAAIVVQAIGAVYPTPAPVRQD